MWRKQGKGVFKRRRNMVISLLIGLGAVGLVLAGCGASSSGVATSTQSTLARQSAANTGATQPQANSDINTSGSSTNGSSTNKTAQYGPQYLEKSLQVTMQVSNPTQAAGDLQQWIAQTDTQSTSDGTDYEQAGNNQYNVTLTFLVDADHYDQIEAYLRDYPAQQKGKLINLHETVQDVTNDYVDTQSTLTNLRAEQQRLLTFMNQTQNMSDALNIEQQLTQVEGQINDIEAHLNDLKGQTTFYTVTISVQPVSSVVISPPPASSPWSVVPIWQGAWSAVVAVWQVLAAVLIWLLAFSVYLIPAGIIVWVVRKRLWKHSARLALFAAHAPAETKSE